jgi:MFS family permease
MPVNFVLALGLFNMAAVRASRVLITLYALKLGASPFAIGMLAASFSVIPILLARASGRWTDRFGARWFLLFGVAGSASGMLLPYFYPTLVMVFIAAALSGLSMTFCNVSLQNLVGLLSPAEQRARNFSNYTLAGSMAAFMGPLIAGFSIDHVGYDNACLIVVAIALVPISMLLARGGDLPAGSGEHRPAVNLWHALSEPGIWPVLAASCISQVATDLFQFYMPVYAHSAGLSPSAIGIVLAAYSVATFAARTVLPGVVKRSGEHRVLGGAFLLAGVSFIAVPLFQNAILLSLVSFAIGLGMGCSAPITMMLTFARSKEGQSGEALGMRQTVDNLTRLVSPMLFGAIASGAGLAAVFWLNAAMLGSGGLFARTRIASRRKS